MSGPRRYPVPSAGQQSCHTLYYSDEAGLLKDKHSKFHMDPHMVTQQCSSMLMYLMSDLLSLPRKPLLRAGLDDSYTSASFAKDTFDAISETRSSGIWKGTLP
ncbi:40S ribosomal protein S2 [Sciurus carolinensis]|uniref:40S ribosomal protein S2 n=1 Tax=Sciurus carolinensis TaxID=30640 RepID=A0AA41MHE2_SCICA|nr:40S ribosomal protein S2 [Sciurus carolinensis]